MATLITKNSSTASAVPAAGDLVKGELAVNVTDKKLYTKDNGGSVVKVVGGLGNQEANAVAITGGAINGTTIGATTASTGAFTTVSASSGFTGNLTGNVTGNVSGTAANVTGIVAPANGGTGLSALGTGVQTALGQNVTGSGSFVLSTSPSLTTPNLGTPSAAVLTNATGLPLTTGVTGTLGVANGGTGITAFGTGVATALGQNVTGSGGIVLAASPSLTTPNLGTPSAATLTNATGLPISTGVSGLGTGVATALAVNTGSAGAFVVNGGALGTPSSGTLTNATGLPLSTGVTGTLATTNGGTGLTSFTANGVVYASSSSALTTGSALTFDGASLGIGTTSPIRRLTVSNSGAEGLEIGPGAANGDTAGAVTSIYYNRSGSAYVNAIQSASNFIYQISGTEGMRLTSTGLGIGTSSPDAKLDVTSAGSAAAYTVSAVIQDGTYPASGNPTLEFNGFIGGNGYRSGIGSIGGQQLAFYTPSTFGVAPTRQMTLNESGNLGIGTSSPAYKLDVSTSGTTTIRSISTANGDIGRLLVASKTSGAVDVVGVFASEGNGSDVAIGTTSNHPIVFLTNNGEKMRLDSSGNLGLGVTPSAWSTAGGSKAFQISDFGAALSSYGGGNTSSSLTHNAYFDGTNWRYTANSIGSALYQMTGSNGGSTHSWSIAAGGTAGNTISFTQAMTLDASGNLGVITTTPTSFLSNWNGLAVGTTSGSNGIAIVSGTASPGTLAFADGTSGADQYRGYVQYSHSSNSLVFGTDGTERARITSGGDLLVGTTSTQTGVAGDAVGITLYGPSATGTGIFVRNGVPLYANNKNANGALIQFYCNGNNVGTISSDGTSTAYNTSSDYRLKDNPQPLTGSGAFIDALKPKTWNWKSDGSKGVGFIAHEVQEVSPGSVTGEKDGEQMQAMEYGSAEFIANIIAELQSLRARVAQLEAK